jgi:dCMP deaminase
MGYKTFVSKRTKWDRFYLGAAEYEATMSKDPSSQFGAVIVNSNNVRVASGFNGFAKGFRDLPERWNDRPYKYRHVIHAEENALLHADADLCGHTIYVSGFPCSSCMSKIAQKGIKQVVTYIPTEDYLSRWSVEEPLQVARECGIVVIEYKKERGDGV